MTLKKILLPLHPFTVPLSGLKAGRNHFEWDADSSFFGIFDNTDITDAALHVTADVMLHGGGVAVSCHIEGTVTTVCDRCLGRLEIPVDTGFDDDDYVLADTLDLSQDVYDYVLLSLPMVRTHPEGECDEDTVKFLGK